MSIDNPAFAQWRLDAASCFAQTMIVIDDEATQMPFSSGPEPTDTLTRPNRRTRATRAKAEALTPAQRREPSGSGKHALNSKSLIDRAMDLGLICSVLRPKQGENFRKRVVHAAKFADIVCLDWEIYGDGGNAAAKIVKSIIQEDTKQGGRLRLIAIYTGDTTNIKILERILDAIPKKIRREQRFRRHSSLEVKSESGTRIICLFKTHGMKMLAPRDVNQVSEGELPQRLRSEFAILSEGLLSNVALATAGAIRRSIHHILAKFVGSMDGPYFHHRAGIASPEDAEGYAVDIVLSELKGSVDKQRVAAAYASHEAIRARVSEMAGSAEKLKLHYGDGASKVYELPLDASVRMIQDGIDHFFNNGSLQNPPKRKEFERKFSTLFYREPEKARLEMHRFAALTTVRAHPANHLYRSGQLVAKLGLGTIVQARDRTYLMCLQASCDSERVRGKRSFIFVPLDRTDAKPEQVVSVSSSGNKLDFVGLRTSTESYRAVRSIEFLGCPETKTVTAKAMRNRSGFHFEDIQGNTYRWIADIKRRRALRTAQLLGQDMGRLGFDEFEPYRLNPNERANGPT